MAQNKLPSLDKSWSALKTETEHTEKVDNIKTNVINLYSYITRI